MQWENKTIVTIEINGQKVTGESNKVHNQLMDYERAKQRENEKKFDEQNDNDNGMKLRFIGSGIQRF